MNDAPPRAAVSWQRCLVRVVGLFILWLAFFGTSIADLWVGVVAACLGTWASYRLLPQTTLGARPLALARVVADFAWYSALAGIDVAARALDPRRALHPGLVVYRTAVPEGPARNAFAAFESLMPGTMPAGYDESGRLLIHCLDIDSPVVSGLLKDERQLRHALGRAGSG